MREVGSEHRSSDAGRAHLRLVHDAGRRVERAADAEAEPHRVRLGAEADPPHTPFALDTASRARHMLLTGMPGTGKSTVLMNLVLDDLASGTGACLIDPHGALVDSILARCDPARHDLDRIVVVDAAERACPIGIDLLAVRDEDEQDLVVQFFLALFQRMFLLEQQGPIFFQATRHGLLLLMQTHGTLAEFSSIFADKDYLKRRLEQCQDPWVRRYFEKTWLGQSDFLRSETLAYITSKFSGLVEDRLMRNIFAQQGGLDIEAAMAERKVVLVSLSQARLGDINARLLAQILQQKFRMAAMRRDAAAAPPLFNLYVDEAHEMRSTVMLEILTGTRKFGLGLTLANQSLGDYPSYLQDTIFGSVASFVTLRQGTDVDGRLRYLGSPRFGLDDLLRLRDYEAVAVCLADASRGRPRKIRLDPPPPLTGAEPAALRAASAQRYGRPRAEIEAGLLQSLHGKS